MAQLNETQIQNVTSEVLEHMMNPKNYGIIQNATGVGMGIDKATNEFAMIYLDIEDDKLKDIKYGCQACQDTVVAGSLFTEMIKGESLEYAKETAKRLAIKIQDAPPKQQACSGMIIKGFEAALLHKEAKQNGEDIDMVQLELGISCEGEENK